MVAAAAVLAGTLAGCAMRVDTYVNRAAEFNRYRTYVLEPAERFETGDPRLDNNPFFQDRVEAAIQRGLAGRGFEAVASDRPELLVHYHASVTQEIAADTTDQRYGYENDEERGPFVYDAGTLVIDFIDARTNRLVWRGWVEGNFDGVIDNQQWLEERIDRSVAAIIGKLPGRI